jgi:hypothetical protein
VLPGRHAKSAPSEPAPQPRPAEPLALLATCIADSLGVAHCIIEYSSASGELFQACTPSTQAIYEALRSIDPAATGPSRTPPARSPQTRSAFSPATRSISSQAR